MNKTRKIVAVICIASLASGLVAAQTKQPFGEVIDVHLVTIEVAVESRFSRKPVLDLERSNFSIREDGEERAITHFERVLEGQRDLIQGLDDHQELEASTNQQVGGQVALAFDLTSLQPPYLKRAVAAAKSFIASDNAPNASYSIVLISSRPDFLVPFTLDRARVVAGLSAIEDITRGRLLPSQGQAFGAPARFLAGGTGLGNASEFHFSDGQDDSSALQEMVEGSEQAVCYFRALGFADRLSEIFRGWPYGDGSKSLVLFYEPNENCRFENDVKKGGLERVHRVGRLFDEVSRQAVAAGIKVYATQGTGLTNPAKKRFASLTEVSPQLYVDQVTDRTGGLHVNVNDLARGIEIARATSANHYRLSFQVARAPDGRTHQIEVEVEGAGRASLRYPQSYDDLDSRTRLEQQLHTSANIPKSGGTLPVSMRVQVEPIRSGLMPVVATIELPGQELGLRWTPEREYPEVELFAAIYSEGGELLELTSKAWPPAGASLDDGAASSFSMALPAGRYTVTLAALDLVTGRYGLDFTQIHP